VVKAGLAGEHEAVGVYFTHPVDLAKDFEAFAEGASTSSTWLSPKRCGRRSGSGVYIGPA
jgi:hypothetical protein